MKDVLWLSAGMTLWIMTGEVIVGVATLMIFMNSQKEGNAWSP